MNTVARAVLWTLIITPLPCAYSQTVPTTLEDFFQPGSQPTSGVTYVSFRSSAVCATCHTAGSAGAEAIYEPWRGSMMAHSARDPLFLASLAIANQDADFAGDLCLRCHTPGGWISGRSSPPDGSSLTGSDRDGVNCTACHRMVEPAYLPGVSPIVDETILGDIDPLPTRPGGGNFVLDPQRRYRGPYDDLAGNPGHAFASTPYYRSSAYCGTCHDIGNPAFERQADDTYALTAIDAAHPTGDPYDMFPLERTYSEWLHSSFARGGVDMMGRFGGNQPVVSTCQDCHMPRRLGVGSNVTGAPLRDDLAAHDLAGGNAWVQDMLINLYPNDGIDPAHLEAGKQRAISMLTRACSLETVQEGNRIRIRIVNETGHKLPTGYPEGRRMWINVEVFDEALTLIEDHGAYDDVSAELSVDDTKVYESNLGVDAAVSEATGIPEGKSFHFAVNNVILKDNRIPPRGFTNAAYREVQAAPIGTQYADGQYWDDTWYRLPIAARFVTVRVYYQTASKEYITFLRDENRTDSAGDVLYQQWELTGKSPPVLMAVSSLTLGPFADGDIDGDRTITLDDYAVFELHCLTGPGRPYVDPGCWRVDFDDNGGGDLRDFSDLAVGLGG